MKKLIGKTNMATVLSLLGTVLGLAGTILSGMASEKNMEAIIDEKVKEALKISK